MGNLYHVLHKLSLVIKSNLRQCLSQIPLNPIFEILESGYTNTIISSVVTTIQLKALRNACSKIWRPLSSVLCLQSHLTVANKIKKYPISCYAFFSVKQVSTINRSEETALNIDQHFVFELGDLLFLNGYHSFQLSWSASLGGTVMPYISN